MSFVASFPTKHPVSKVENKCITKIVSRFPFFVEQSPLFSEQSPPFLSSQKSSFFLQARDAFSRMGWLPWLCWKARSRVASSGCEAADADRAASRHAASRVDSLGRRSGSWSSGLWRMVNPSASEPADDSAAHFQIDCKSTREAAVSWNEATGGYDEARCRAALPEG